MTNPNSVWNSIPFNQNGPQPAATDPRAKINVTNLDIPTIAQQAWDAVCTANDPPTLYRRGGELARLETNDDGAAILAPVDRRRLRGILARSCLFTETSRQTARIIEPPGVVVDDMLVNVDPRLPLITRVVRCPIFDASGALLDVPGYHPTAAAYYDPPAGLLIPPVPDDPTADDLERAKALILDDLLGDFPFVTDADRAHAVALVLLPMLRDRVRGPTPLHLIEAATMGSGKGLLASAALIPATGTAPTVMAAATNEDEWRKRITSALLLGSPVILIDNLTQTLGSGALAAALTATDWTDRRLGQLDMVSAPNRSAWVATGNNPMLSTEIARRCIRVRIDPKVDKPWERTGFRHDPLQQWAVLHRGDLIWATLTLIRYGTQHGAAPTKTLGSFESWAAVIGQVLDGARIPGFLMNLDELYERADVEMGAWRALIGAWWNQYQNQEKATADLYNLLEQHTIDLPLRGKTERAMRISFGMLLAGMQDRVLTTTDEAGAVIHLQITASRTIHKVKQWKLVQTAGGTSVSCVSFGTPSTRGPARGQEPAAKKDTLDTQDTPDADNDPPYYDREPDGNYGGDDDQERLALEFARKGNRGAAEYTARGIADAARRDRALKCIDRICGADLPDDLPEVAAGLADRLKAQQVGA